MDHTIKPSEMENYFTPEVMGAISYGLDHHDVHAPNFGEHTLNGIDELLIQARVQDNREAFEMLRALNEVQVKGIVQFNLNRDQVLSPNFGEHTLQFLYQTKRRKQKTHQEAFNLVEGLNRTQIYAISHYDLSKLDVQNLNLEQSTLDGAMETLKALNENASDKYLYETVSNMSESQLNSITKQQLSLEQVGIDLVDGKFKNQNPQENQLLISPVKAQKNNEETEISSKNLEALRKLQNLKPSSSGISGNSSSDDCKPAAKRKSVRLTTPADDNSGKNTTNKKSKKKGIS